jgi:hypothetical protein
MTNAPLPSPDDRTIDAYDRHAAAFANDWHAQPPRPPLRGVVRAQAVS